MKWLAILLIVGILLIPTPAAAKSDVYLEYVSAKVDGATVISFRGINGAATTVGSPSVGWVSGYADIDCDWTGFWCDGVTFLQNGTGYAAYWI
jgi:hypothetical protein